VTVTMIVLAIVMVTVGVVVAVKENAFIYLPDTTLHYTTSHTAHHTPDHSSSYSQIRSSFLLIIHTLTIYPIPVPSSLGSVDMITAAMVFHHVTHAKAGKCVSAHRSAEETAVCVKL
jgi:hypothetical protein